MPEILLFVVGFNPRIMISEKFTHFYLLLKLKEWLRRAADLNSRARNAITYGQSGLNLMRTRNASALQVHSRIPASGAHWEKINSQKIGRQEGGGCGVNFCFYIMYLERAISIGMQVVYQCQWPSRGGGQPEISSGFLIHFSHQVYLHQKIWCILVYGKTFSFPKINSFFPKNVFLIPKTFFSRIITFQSRKTKKSYFYHFLPKFTKFTTFNHINHF